MTTKISSPNSKSFQTCGIRVLDEKGRSHLYYQPAAGDYAMSVQESLSNLGLELGVPREKIGAVVSNLMDSYPITKESQFAEGFSWTYRVGGLVIQWMDLKVSDLSLKRPGVWEMTWGNSIAHNLPSNHALECVVMYIRDRVMPKV